MPIDSRTSVARARNISPAVIQRLPQRRDSRPRSLAASAIGSTAQRLTSPMKLQCGERPIQPTYSTGPSHISVIEVI